MPEIILNSNEGNNVPGTVTQVRWLDQQQYLIETYRQLRTNLGQLEAEIEAARLRVTDWSQHRREPSRSRSLSHASLSTNTSSHWSCSTFDSVSTDPACLNVLTDCTCSSGPSSCSSACNIQLPANVAVSLNAATIISAFLAANASQNLCPAPTISEGVVVVTKSGSDTEDSRPNTNDVAASSA